MKSLCEFLGLDSESVKETSAETFDEVYWASTMLLYHEGLIFIPDYLDPVYRNPEHTQEGALQHLRWVCAKMISFLGSCPSTHVKFRYDLLGLPQHLARYTKGIPRRYL